MKFNQFARAFAPIVGIALAAAVAGCDSKTSFNINGEEGKKLADLDLTGKAPDEVVVAGPDEVQITQGDALAITVDGDPDAVDQVRFTLKDGALGIMREGKIFQKDGKLAIVKVTMPAPREVVLAGSGKLAAAALAPAAKVTVAGSGTVDAASVGADSLDLNIAGSGRFQGAGVTRKLDMTVAGSGSADMAALKIDTAKVTIAGSGDATFASDGDVDATIMGSGSVTVKGRARCKVNSMGSGKLICEGPVENAGPGAAPVPPTPPTPPAPPSAP